MTDSRHRRSSRGLAVGGPSDDGVPTEHPGGPQPLTEAGDAFTIGRGVLAEGGEEDHHQDQRDRSGDADQQLAQPAPVADSAQESAAATKVRTGSWKARRTPAKC